MNIYVGNLSSATKAEDLKSVFEVYGTVNNVKLIVDFETGMSKGFGFIDMSQNEGTKAMEALNGSELQGNSIIVNEAYEREKKRNFGGGGRNNFGGGNRNGGGNRGGGGRGRF